MVSFGDRLPSNVHIQHCYLLSSEFFLHQNPENINCQNEYPKCFTKQHKWDKLISSTYFIFNMR